MKVRIRIRPRTWPAQPKPQTGWGWVPLSLIFRKQRQPERPVRSTPGPTLSPSGSPLFLTLHRHHHTYEGQRILTRSIQRASLFFQRVTVDRPVLEKNLHCTAGSVPNPPTRELIAERHLRISTSRELRRTFTTTHRFTGNVSEAPPVSRPPQTGPVDGHSVTFSHRPFVRPAPLRTRVTGGSTPLVPRREMAMDSRGRQVSLAREHHVAPRLRQAVREPVLMPEKSIGAPSVEQVWRRGPRAMRESSSIEARSLTEFAKTTATNPPAHHRADLPANVLAAAPAAPFRLEGAAMDRLAEDVFKRIERHVRIERERRGI